MKMVRGHGEARWLPSRHHFALFRLAAYLRLRSARHEPTDTILGIDRHQSNFEMTAVASWYLLTVTCCFAAMMPLPVAFAAAVFVVHVAVVGTGVLTSTILGDRGMKVNSIVMMTLLAALAAHGTTRTTWVRFAGWQFFALLALNAVAAAIVFLLRDSIARLEDSIGGASSAH